MASPVKKYSMFRNFIFYDSNWFFWVRSSSIVTTRNLTKFVVLISMLLNIMVGSYHGTKTAQFEPASYFKTKISLDNFKEILATLNFENKSSAMSTLKCCLLIAFLGLLNYNRPLRYGVIV